MTTLAIVQSCYIPWKGYFDLIRRSDVFVLYDCVQYTDRDWRNRNRIKTEQGLQWLTIPVHSGRESTIAEVVCADTSWQKKHWSSLHRAYAKAPFFERYAPALEELYLSHYTMLSEVNQRFTQAICSLAGISTPLHLLKEHVVAAGDRTDKLIAVCKHHNATRYLSGPSAKAYLDIEKFAAAGIEVEWAEYGHYAQYPQFHPPFEHGVTILDLLFHVGPAWEKYL